MKKTTNQMVERPPVVVIMGHIDHGKSTLLDYIQKTKVAENEAGGITQHVSAYEAKIKTPAGEKKITFIDTPGHASFAGMRERGAVLADICILIVSAEEGVKEQTAEVIKVVKELKLPLVIAINKIDRPNADPNKIKQELAEQEVMVEGYGGKIPVAEISARDGTGVDELLELVLLTAELEEFRTDPDALAEGFVLEARVDQRAGTTATLIIKNGILESNHWIVVGGQASKIKRLTDFAGQAVKKLNPCAPAVVLGFNELPTTGSPFRAFADRREAEAFAAEQVTARQNRTEGGQTSGISKRLASEQAEVSLQPEATEIPLVIKADAAGTVEAVIKEVKKWETKQAKLKILSAGVGRISEGDVQLGAPIVVGFNVRVDKAAKELAGKNKVEIKTFDVIYHLSEWLEEAIEARRPKIIERLVKGRARLLKLFGTDRNKQIVGGTVVEGELTEGSKVIISRRESELGEGRVVELQHQKVRTKKVEAGKQFGATIEARIGLAAGDHFESFELVEK